jgi:hypothetical protein
MFEIFSKNGLIIKLNDRFVIFAMFSISRKFSKIIKINIRTGVRFIEKYEEINFVVLSLYFTKYVCFNA